MIFFQIKYNHRELAYVAILPVVLKTDTIAYMAS